jgi:multiple sugar transport system substrate-binding protein
MKAKQILAMMLAALMIISLNACKPSVKNSEASGSGASTSGASKVDTSQSNASQSDSKDIDSVASNNSSTANSNNAASTASSKTNTTSAIAVPKTITPKTCTLTLACVDVANEKTIANSIIKAFSKVYPNVTVKLTPINGDYNSKILTQAVSKTLPDVLFTFDLQTRVFAQNGVLLPLDSYMKTFGYDSNNYFGNIMSLGKGDNGKTYMIPREYSHLVTAVNLSVIEAEENIAGADFIKKYASWTMNDFITLSKKYTHKDGSGKIVQYGADINYNWEPVWTSFSLGYGGSLLNGSKQATFSDTKTVTGLTTLLDLVKGKYVYDNLRPDPANPYPFQKGMAAFSFISRPGLPDVNTTLSRMGMKWDVLPFPRTPVKAVVGMGTTGYGVSAYTKNPYEASLLAYFVATTEGQTAFVSTGAGVPVIKSLKDSAIWRNYPVPNKNSDAFVSNPQNDVKSVFSFSFNVKKVTTFQTLFNSYMLKYLVGEMSVADTMKAMDAVLNG